MVDLPESQRPYKFIATSQGSQCAKNVFEGSNVTMASQDELFTALRVYYFWIGKKYWLNTNIKSLPTTGVSTILDYKMEARFSILGVGFGWKTIREKHPVNPVNFVNWDGTAGGTQSIKGRTGGGLSEGLQNVGPWYLYNILSAKAGLSLNIAKDQFSFVNITSALDAPESTPLNTVFNYNMFGNSNTRVDKFVSQEFYQNTNNIFHTDYTPRNAKWMFNEMENITQPISCIDVCQPGEGGYQISGPEVVCTTGIYTISGLPLGTVFTWGVSGNGTIASISPNGLSATVTRIGSGLVNVIATIPAVANCIPQQEVTKAVKVGPPSAGTLFAQYSSGVNAGILLKQVNCMEPYLPGSFQANINWYDYVGTNFSWLLVSKSAGSTANFQMGPGNQSATITLRPQNAYATYRLTVTNACGSYQKSYKFNASSTDCPDIVEVPFLVSPNPTSSRITLDLKGTEIVSIRIKDKFGNVVKAIKEVKMASRVEVNLSQLKTDIYIVEVFDGKTWFVKKVIKQ